MKRSNPTDPTSVVHDMESLMPTRGTRRSNPERSTSSRPLTGTRASSTAIVGSKLTGRCCLSTMLCSRDKSEVLCQMAFLTIAGSPGSTGWRTVTAYGSISLPNPSASSQNRIQGSPCRQPSARTNAGSTVSLLSRSDQARVPIKDQLRNQAFSSGCMAFDDMNESPGPGLFTLATPPGRGPRGSKLRFFSCTPAPARVI